MGCLSLYVDVGGGEIDTDVFGKRLLEENPANKKKLEKAVWEFRPYIWPPWRLFRPIAGTTFNELELFLAQFTLNPFGSDDGIAGNGDVRKVSVWLSHADIQTTETYLRADPRLLPERKQPFLTARAVNPNTRRGLPLDRMHRQVYEF